MELKIYKGTALLDTKGLHKDGRVYIPDDALESYVGLWEGETVFLNSPLAGKKICFTVLSPDSYANALPPALEEFVALCSAAGAQLIYHDGGKFPSGDLLLALEPGGAHTSVQYLGLRKSLARRIAANLKRGLKLAYLADPVLFKKPQFNIKMSLLSRLFTPAVAVQWPSNLDLGPWLFTSLMEYFGRSIGMDGSLFAPKAITAVDTDAESPAPAVLPEPAAVPEPAPKKIVLPEPSQNQVGPPQLKTSLLPSAFEKPAISRRQEAALPRSSPCLTSSHSPAPGHSASMSPAQYPDFFAQMNKGRKIVKKEPFT